MSSFHIVHPIEVLMVEDNPGDVRLTQEALRESKLYCRVDTVEDGEQAMRFLRREREYAAVHRPDLILLDLNLPRKDGREVLREIKQDEGLKEIPVVILTTSRDEQDIVRSYRLHANCYVTKPVGLNEFTNVVRSIENFWFTVVKLPPR